MASGSCRASRSASAPLPEASMAGAPPPPGPTLPAPQGARDVLGGEAAELPGPLHAGGGCLAVAQREDVRGARCWRLCS